MDKPNKPLDYEKLNKAPTETTEPVCGGGIEMLNGNLTPEQKYVQGMITREMGSFVDEMCEKYELAIDFKVMLIFPKDWGREAKYGKN